VNPALIVTAAGAPPPWLPAKVQKRMMCPEVVMPSTRTQPDPKPEKEQVSRARRSEPAVAWSANDPGGPRNWMPEIVTSSAPTSVMMGPGTAIGPKVTPGPVVSKRKVLLIVQSKGYDPGLIRTTPLTSTLSTAFCGVRYGFPGLPSPVASLP